MLLDEIKQLNEIRSGSYGHPLPNFLRISLAWSVKKAPVLFNPIEVAEMMLLMKEMRNVNSTKWDNYRDEVGYVNTIDLMCALFCEIKQQQFSSYELLTDDMYFYVSNTYQFMTDSQKEIVANKLKSLSFGEQYDLLSKSVEFLKGKESE